MEINIDGPELKNGHTNLLMRSENGKQKDVVQTTPDARTPFTVPLLHELAVGETGSISKDAVARVGDKFWILNTFAIFPLAYWKAGTMVKIKRLLPGKGRNAFSIDGYKATIAPLVSKYAYYPNMFLRLRGYVGPIDASFEVLSDQNWWKSCMVEDLIVSLLEVSYKRTRPDWYEAALTYAIERVGAKVIRYEQALELFTQIYGIKALAPLCEALATAMKDDGKRYKEQFDEDTMRRIVNDFSGVPKPVFEKFQESLNLSPHKMGYRNSNDG